VGGSKKKESNNPEGKNLGKVTNERWETCRTNTLETREKGGRNAFLEETQKKSRSIKKRRIERFQSREDRTMAVTV